MARKAKVRHETGRSAATGIEEILYEHGSRALSFTGVGRPIAVPETNAQAELQISRVFCNRPDLHEY